MTYTTIVSDWHGTLTSTSEEDSNKRIGYTLLGEALRDVKHGRIWRVAQLLKLLAAKKTTERMLREFHQRKRRLKEVYEPFNSAIKGVTFDYIEGIADGFARDTVENLDERVIVPIKNMHEKGKKTGILSVGYKRIIEKTLEQVGYSDVFDKIFANTLLGYDGKAVGFSLDVYEEKARYIMSRFLDIHTREGDILYIGDSSDDMPVAQMLPKGNFIVPFLAPYEFKEEMARKYGAFVPESQKDLERYFKAR